MSKCDMLAFGGLATILVGIGLISIPATLIVGGLCACCLGILGAKHEPD